MATGSVEPDKELTLTVEEAYALLAMCLASPLEFDVDAMSAVDKLTDYCIQLDKQSEQDVPRNPTETI